MEEETCLAREVKRSPVKSFRSISRPRFLRTSHLKVLAQQSHASNGFELSNMEPSSTLVGSNLSQNLMF